MEACGICRAGLGLLKEARAGEDEDFETFTGAVEALDGGAADALDELLEFVSLSELVVLSLSESDIVITSCVLAVACMRVVAGVVRCLDCPVVAARLIGAASFDELFRVDEAVDDDLDKRSALLAATLLQLIVIVGGLAATMDLLLGLLVLLLLVSFASDELEELLVLVIIGGGALAKTAQELTTAGSDAETVTSVSVAVDTATSASCTPLLPVELDR